MVGKVQGRRYGNGCALSDVPVQEDALGALLCNVRTLCIEDTHGEVELAVLGIQCCLKQRWVWSA